MKHTGWLQTGAVVLTFTILTVVFALILKSASDDCARRGGHLETTSWIWTGKVMVPVDTCVGAR